MKSVFKKNKNYIYSFSITLAALFIIAYALKVYPFGNNTFLWTDADQYISFYSYIKSLPGKNDIFYSWANVLGGNALPTLSYYAFSPFNILYIIFQNHFIFCIHLITFLKISLSAVTLCYCLEQLYPKHNLFKIMFSFSYALCGYSVFYLWNASWLDGVLFLPLVFTGIRKLIYKNKIGLYIFSLTVTIISNFYIGYMVCIASVLLYIAQLILKSDTFIADAKKTFGKYVFASLISGGLSAFVLIPTILGLPESRKVSLLEKIKSMSFSLDPANILSGLFSGQINSLDSNAPLIYVGLFPLLLCILFFMCKEITFKKKVIYGSLLLILFFCFENSFINLIWHGFTDNAWFNYRYSFIFCFILILTAFESVIYISSLSKKSIVKSAFIIVLISFLVINLAYSKVRPLWLFMDIICLCLITFGLLMSRNLKVLIPFLTIPIFFSAVFNAYGYLHNYDTKKISDYAYTSSIINDMKRVISDDGFYRMESSLRYSSCNAALFDYNGITNYSSAEDTDNLEYMKTLGLYHSWMWGQYTTDLPSAFESLFGFKYILTDTINGKAYTKLASYDELDCYKNQYALPVIFPVYSFNEKITEETDGFLRLNSIWQSINGIDDPVFIKNQLISIKKSTTEENTLSLSFSINWNGGTYIYLPAADYTKIDVDNNIGKQTISYLENQHVYYAGTYNKGDILNLTIETSNENFNADDISCYSENISAIKTNSDMINKYNLNIYEKSSSNLKIAYSGDINNISTTIPYDDSWTVYDNGEKIETMENWNNFLAFKLEGTGEHNIELIYVPKGFIPGSVISICSILILIIYKFLLYKSKKAKL